MTTDAIMERSFSSSIESSLAAHAAAGALVWLVPPPHEHHRHPRFQDQEPLVAASVPPRHDEAGRHDSGDAVADLLDDEFGPRDSDLDEQMLQRPTAQRLLLFATAVTLPQPELDVRIITQLLLHLHGEEAYPNGGFGAVPASAAAVAGLEKRTFRAVGGDDRGCGVVVTECAICFEDFEDGEEVSVVPCPGGHGFHPECIDKWLGQYSNMCPLCRHALLTSVDDGA